MRFCESNSLLYWLPINWHSVIELNFVKPLEAFEEAVEDKHDEESGGGEHEVPFSHVVLTVLLKHNDIVLVLSSLEHVEIVKKHVLRTYVTGQFYL